MAIDLQRLVEDCLRQVAQAEANTTSLQTLARAAAGCMDRLHDSCLTSAGAVWTVFDSALSLNDAALTRCQDFELVATFDLIASRLPPDSFGPITFSAGGAAINLKPAAPPAISSTFGGRLIAYPGAALLVTEWEGTIDGNNVNVVGVVCIVPAISSAGFGVTVSLGCDIRLRDRTGAEFSLLSILPLDDARECQRRVREVVASSLEKLNIPILPPGSSKYLPAGLVLSGLRIRQFLLVAARRFARARNFIALCRAPRDGEDALVRLHAPYMIEAINRKAAESSGRVSGFQWQAVFGDVWIHISRSDSFLWVSVDTDVDLRYSLTFRMAPPLELEAMLVLVEWRAHWEANMCWPKCDDVLEEAQNRTKQQIQENSNIISDVSDFSSDWQSGSVEPDPVALLVALRR